VEGKERSERKASEIGFGSRNRKRGKKKIEEEKGWYICEETWKERRYALNLLLARRAGCAEVTGSGGREW